MIDQKALRFVLFSVIVISLAFEVLSYFKILYQFYIWEIFVDLKILSLLLILLVMKVRNLYQFSLSNLHLRKLDVIKYIFWFGFPILIYTVVVGIGLIFNQVRFENVDNAATLILATVFDIPAIYVFSATSTLIEEIFFRVLLFDALREQRSFWVSVVSSSLIWCIFSITEINSLENPTVIELVSIALYFIAMGLFCTVLVAKYKSIWISYSFRIGIFSVASLILHSLFIEGDSFFETKSVLFFGEGLIVSLLIGLTAFLIGKSVNKNEIVSTGQILQN